MEIALYASTFTVVRKCETNGYVNLYWKCADKTVSNIHPIHRTALRDGGIMRRIRQYIPEVNFFTQAQFDG